MPLGERTYAEILSQPETWTAALDCFARGEAALMRLLHDAPERVIVTGCGSTYYLALTAARLLRYAGRDAIAVPASELLLYPDAVLLTGKAYLLIAVSRSGSTTETVRAHETFRQRRAAPVISVTCDSESPLARAADLTIAIDAAAEESVAQTRSFSSMCLVLQQMAGALTGDDRSSSRRLPGLCRRLLDEHGAMAAALGADERIKRFFFLGSDALYGIACEAMLKMKEMSLAYSEAYHALEFRHGPMSMAGENALVVGLMSAAARQRESAVLQEMRGLGARTLSLAPASGDMERGIGLPDDMPAWNMPALYLPCLQLMAYHRARFNGQDPDAPQNLTAVVSLDDL